MLEDRDYMRQPEFDSPRWSRRFGIRWSLTVWFLIAYATVYFLEKALPGQAGAFIYQHFALSKYGLAHGEVWQLITYQFMHANFLHLFFNGWAIYTFGLAIEEELGRKRFAALMFSSGIIGGVVQIALTWFFGRFFPDIPVVGASACAFGLAAAYATLFPRRELTMLVFFIIPVTVEAKVLLYVSVAMAVIPLFLGRFINMGNIANAAHLGGMAMGWFFVRKIMQGDWSRLTGKLRPVQSNEPRRPTLEPLPKKSGADFLTEEVDPILDKISAHGIQSLTTREREILESARKKMTRS